ncbi:MAG: hypothetical protein HZR80_11655 [Candidatus Heimdallarchaeota archaeon]
MSSDYDYWISVSNFTDVGITPRVNCCNFPLNNDELNTITNSYASILNYILEKSIVGPLPVVNHRGLLVLVFKFEIIDNDVKDKRIVSEGGKTIGLLTLFYKIKLDEIFKKLHKKILQQITVWVKQYNNIRDINQVEITKLMDDINQIKVKQKIKH